MTSLSICATNYDCAHALDRHLQSVYDNLGKFDFEYIVTDNHSKDASQAILREWASRHGNFKVLTRRCTMGEGRQISFDHSRGAHIMVLDTDVVYSPLLKQFLERYLERYEDFSVQALFCGIFPRNQWLQVGGRRSLNTNEDVDMWLRLVRLGTMRWYTVAMGENLKEPAALGSSDHLSSRYTKGERVTRLFRREWDLLKTRRVQFVDLDRLIRESTIDFGLGVPIGPWPQRRLRIGRSRRMAAFVRDLRQVLRSS
ncbi:MAG TPA: glycosyltransferase [Thermoplasmata archaeon]|nr:glycosyltransferase [Thermoplasmata archaeon]